MTISRFDLDRTVTTGSATGSGTIDVTDLNSHAGRTQVVISGLATGTMTVKVKGFKGDVFEDIDTNTMNLATQRTMLIKDAHLDAIRLTVSPAAAFTFSIYQDE